MARQTNIVSFDAARSASQSQRRDFSQPESGIRASSDPSRSPARLAQGPSRAGAAARSRDDAPYARSSAASRNRAASTTRDNGRSRRRSTPARESNVRTRYDLFQEPDYGARSRSNGRSASSSDSRALSRRRSQSESLGRSRSKSAGSRFSLQSLLQIPSAIVGRIASRRSAAKDASSNRRSRRTSEARQLDAGSRRDRFAQQSRAARRSGDARMRDEFVASGRFEDESAREDDGERAYASARRSRSSKRELQSKQRLRARAEKMFNKQFGGRDDGAASEGAPRAAVYKGEVGKTQRRAARMIPARGFVGSAAAKFNPFSWFANFSVPAPKLIAATVAICVVASCVTLYGPVQQYYQSVRENDRLQVQYQALENRSATLEAQHQTLTSDAGIETIAHENYGWVKAGEETAWVEGLSYEAYNNKETGIGIAANVDINSIGYPQTWYSPFLDFVFDVH